MWYHRLARRLFCIAFVAAAAPGCQALITYRPVEVVVQDIESKQPIAGAEVHLSYPLSSPGQSPRESSGTSRENGVAQLEAAPCSDGDILVEVQAPGHLSEHNSLPGEAARALASSHWYQRGDQHPIHFVIEMYADPSPTVELVVPTGYRGTVRVNMQARNDIPCPPGQRCFRYNLSAKGEAQISGLPLLRRVAATDFRAVFADGAPISREAKGAVVGLWWLRTDGGDMLFVVGTQDEFESYRGFQSMEHAVKQAMSSGGRSAGGGKGGGRHGQQSQNDSNPGGAPP